MKSLILGLIALVLAATFVVAASSQLVNLTNKASSTFSVQTNSMQPSTNLHHSNAHSISYNDNSPDDDSDETVHNSIILLRYTFNNITPNSTGNLVFHETINISQGGTYRLAVDGENLDEVFSNLTVAVNINGNTYYLYPVDGPDHVYISLTSGTYNVTISVSYTTYSQISQGTYAELLVHMHISHHNGDDHGDSEDDSD